MTCLKAVQLRCFSLLGAITLILSACASPPVIHDSGPPPGSVDVTAIPDAVPKVEARSRYGNPESYVVLGQRYEVMEDSHGFVQRGIASWYGKKFHGRRTSSGETYDMYAMTAAHKNLPLPTYVEIRNLKNGKKIIVRVNDRGPFHENRIIDLSYTAAAKLDIIKNGTGLVEIRAINPGSYRKEGAPVRTVNTGSGISGFFIQVGAFSHYNNALKLKTRLSGLNENVRINEKLKNGSRIYRVQLGPIENIDVADKLVANLSRYGVYEHRIVIDDGSVN